MKSFEIFLHVISKKMFTLGLSTEPNFLSSIKIIAQIFNYDLYQLLKGIAK